MSNYQGKGFEILEKIKQGEILIADGAMGTYIYQKGVFINRCYDELNLSMPHLIKEIHDEYILAGADIIETNTFGGNQFRLTPHGLGDKVEEINYKGAIIARECADKCERTIYVAGSVGPLGIKIEPYGSTSYVETRNAFKRQIKALIDGGVDILILESFTDLYELKEALMAVKSLGDIPCITQMTINPDGSTLYGTEPEVFSHLLEEWGASVIGINCSVGPAFTLTALERINATVETPLSAMPDAGLPKKMDGRNMHLCSPEYIAEYAKRFVEMGASIVGGCCGTTPEHISEIRKAVKKFKSQKKKEVISHVADLEISEQMVAPEKKSKFAAKIYRGEEVFSIEITPPKGPDPERILRRVEKLKNFGIDAINIPDGPRASSRMSALALAVLVESRLGMETVLHYCCRDRNLLGMQSDLLGASALGIKNLLVITGDSPKMGSFPDATGVFDIDSIGLTNIVNYFNHGFDIGKNPIGKPTSFLIGVGVNPGSLDLEQELNRFKWKKNAGAEFAITQPIFEIEVLEEFMEKIADFSIPVIAGIWPLRSLKNAEFLNNEVPGVNVPESILNRMRKWDDPQDAQKEGIEISIEFMEKFRGKLAGFQVSAPFGNVQAPLQIIEDYRGKRNGE